MQRGAASPGRAVMRATPANGEMREAGRRVFEAEEIGSGQDRSAGAGSNRARPPASVSPTATGREGRTSQTSSLASSRDSLKNSLVLTVSNGPVALKSNGCGDYDLPLRASGKTHYDPSRNQCEEDKRIRNVLRLPQGTSTTRFARCSTSSSCVSTSFSSDFGS